MLSITFHNKTHTNANSTELVNVFVPNTIRTYELERSIKYLLYFNFRILHILKNIFAIKLFIYLNYK